MIDNKFSPVAFLKSVLSYSVATWINFLIYGAATILTTYLLPPSIFGPVDMFLSSATLIMNIVVLGLDQSFIRFFNEPPHPLNSKSLLTLCIFISGSVLLLTGLVSSLLFSQNILRLFFNMQLPNYFVPLLFINAFCLMIARFYNIAYRMEGSLKLYTIQSVGLQFASRLFFIFGVFIKADLVTLIFFLTGGLVIFTAVFALLRRDRWLPETNSFSGNAPSQLLPYGLALAPTAVMLYLSSLYSKALIGRSFGDTQQGIFSMVLLLSNVIAVVQAGFATFWSAYIYANYKTQQQQIKKIHEYIMIITTLFYCALVAFEDLLFIILGVHYQEGMKLFPLLSLVPLFLIISETTVYGISIAKKPIFDTIGIALSLCGNILFCSLFAKLYGPIGVAGGLVLSGFLMFLFRTITAQRFYSSILKPLRTAFSILFVVTLGITATFFTDNFAIKFTSSAICGIVYIWIYRSEVFEAILFFKKILILPKKI